MEIYNNSRIRLCCGDWVYCDAICSNCDFKIKTMISHQTYTKTVLSKESTPKENNIKYCPFVAKSWRSK